VFLSCLGPNRTPEFQKLWLWGQAEKKWSCERLIVAQEHFKKVRNRNQFQKKKKARGGKY
jgi:hypothetical protein